jgi:hypothetical protein
VIGAVGFTAMFIYGGRKLWIEAKAELAEIEAADAKAKVLEGLSEPN